MSRKIQIDLNMFFDIYKLIYILKRYEMDEDAIELIERLKNAFDDKIDAMQRHDLYTQSKISKIEEEKEKSKQRYLDLVGMDKSWRYNKNF